MANGKWLIVLLLAICYMLLAKYQSHLMVLLGLIILNLAFFGLNLNDFFLSDDFDWLTIAKSEEYSLSDYFSANYYGERGDGGSYRPMVNVIFWLNYNLFSLNPLGYHIVNLFFHIGVCFLVYLLALALFEKLKNKNKIAILAAAFFAILPNHSEAVIWIAAVGDPLATFFYLLAFYLYLLFRQKQNFSALLVSIASFIIVLLIKEIAITLPLLIVVWELYQAISKNKFKARNLVLYPLGYWLLVIGYFFIRYSAIGLVFGYYARESFKIDFNAVFKMIAALISNLFFYGQTRVFLIDYFSDHKIFFVLLIILLAALILYACRRYFYKAAFLIDAYLILILPVIFLAFNNLNDEGERYNYLPSVAFVILLSLLIWQMPENKIFKKPSIDPLTWLPPSLLLRRTGRMTARAVVIGVLIIYFAVNLFNKDYNWHLASSLSKKIVQQDAPQVLDLGRENYFVALPDNLDGAPLLRNGLVLGINLFYPELEFKAKVLNVYQCLTRQNYQEKILYWGAYPTGGWIAETFDKKNRVTGFDRQETDQYIFELWNYDYPTYTSNTIRLIFKNKEGNFIPAGKEDFNIIIFDQGSLKSLAK